MWLCMEDAFLNFKIEQLEGPPVRFQQKKCSSKSISQASRVRYPCPRSMSDVMTQCAEALFGKETKRISMHVHISALLLGQEMVKWLCFHWKRKQHFSHNPSRKVYSFRLWTCLCWMSRLCVFNKKRLHPGNVIKMITTIFSFF